MRNVRKPAAEAELSCIEKLSAKHDVGSFASGRNSLDHWLRRYALVNQLEESVQTYVVHRNGCVVGYYSLVYGAVSLEDCPPRVREAMPSMYPVPILKMARLAVDKREPGQGLGMALMKDALVRIVAAADIAGLRAVVVDALDEEVKRFYREKFGFDESPTGRLQLFLRIDDVRAAVNASITGREPK